MDANCFAVVYKSLLDVQFVQILAGGKKCICYSV